MKSETSYNFFYQIVDYGLALRCNHGSLVLSKLPGIIRLLMCLQKNTSDVYMNSLLSELLVKSNNLEEGLPTFDLFDNAFSLFNEEVGEMSFSVLARLMYSKSHEVNLEIVNKLFILVHEYAALDDELLFDGGIQGMRNGYIKVDYEGTAALAIRAFMSTVIRQLRCNQFKIYTGEAKFGNPNFMPTGKDTVIKWTVRPLLPLLWIEDLSEPLKTAFKKLKTSLEKPIKDLYKYWPEFENMVDPQHVHSYKKAVCDIENQQSFFPHEGQTNDGSEDESINGEKSTTTDEDAPLGLDPIVRQKKFLAVLSNNPAKSSKSFPTNSPVWTIDFPEWNEPETAWKITPGTVLPRAIKNKKKNAIATPRECERIRCLDAQGQEEIFDIFKTNLDRSYSLSCTRLKNIRQDLGQEEPDAVHGDEIDDIAPINMLRERNIKEQKMILASLDLTNDMDYW